MTDDEKLKRRYRQLASEEPSAVLDAAILAASRRALGRPSFTRRWGAPLSIAAVLMLAVGVTLNMQLERPGVEYSEPLKPAPPPAAQIQQAPVSPAPQSAARDAAISPPTATAPSPAAPKARSDGPAALERKHAEAFVPAPALKAAPQPFSPSQPTPSALPPAAPAPAAPAAAARIEPPARATAGTAALRARETLQAPSALRDLSARADPAEELERIARLRAEGRHVEADRALEEFRRRHPDFRIPDAMWGRVKPPSPLPSPLPSPKGEGEHPSPLGEGEQPR